MVAEAPGGVCFAASLLHPTWVRTRGRVSVEVAFVFYLHANNPMEASSTKHGLPPHSIAMGKGLPSAERLPRTTGCRPPLRVQKGSDKGLAATSNSEGRTVLSSGPRLLLLLSYWEPSWTAPHPPGLGGRPVLNSLMCNGWMRSFRKLGRETDSLHSLLQRWECSEARWPRLAFVSRHIKMVWDASHKESEAQFTLFWFRMRWFLLSFFFSEGGR